MGLYLYCLVPRGHEPERPLAGLDDARVEVFEAGPFAAWVSTSERPPVSDIASVTRHHDVVRAAAVQATPLPVRFGAWVADERALAQRLDGQRDALAATLATLAGKVEVGVHVTDGEPERADDEEVEPGAGWHADGRGYLRALSMRHQARQRRRDRQDAAARLLRDHLGGLPADERVRRLDAPDLVAVAHLIDREQEDRYRELATDFRHEQAEPCRVYVTGPWPPYSFAAP